MVRIQTQSKTELEEEELTSVQGTGVALMIENVLINTIAIARKVVVGCILTSLFVLYFCRSRMG
jgi:hypothetical protein